MVFAELTDFKKPDRNRHEKNEQGAKQNPKVVSGVRNFLGNHTLSVSCSLVINGSHNKFCGKHNEAE